MEESGVKTGKRAKKVALTGVDSRFQGLTTSETLNGEKNLPEPLSGRYAPQRNRFCEPVSSFSLHRRAKARLSGALRPRTPSQQQRAPHSSPARTAPCGCSEPFRSPPAHGAGKDCANWRRGAMRKAFSIVERRSTVPDFRELGGLRLRPKFRDFWEAEVLPFRYDTDTILQFLLRRSASRQIRANWHISLCSPQWVLKKSYGYIYI